MRNQSKYVLVMLLAWSLAQMAPSAAAIPGPGEGQGGAYLGVTVSNLSPETVAALHLKSANGAFIADVDQDGPACKADLRANDVVISFGGKPVQGSEQLASLIASTSPGSTVPLTIVRSGQTKELKVTLGNRMQWNPHVSNAANGHITAHPPVAFYGGPMPPAPPLAPDVDIPSYTPTFARNGMLVESLCPQLGEFFGVPANKGVLVRSVEKGSPAYAGGLRSGDVIVSVNNETVHDLADWRRALRTQNGKVTVGIVREKHAQTIEMKLPPSTSELKREDWGSSQDMQALAREIEKLGPQMAANAQDWATLAELYQEPMDEVYRPSQPAAKTTTPEKPSAEMKKQTEELHKQAEQMRKQTEAAVRTITPEMKKQADELRKQAREMHKQVEEMRKEAEKMTPELARSAKEMSDAMKPTARELAATARDLQKQMKEMEPQLKQDLEQLKKELEQQKREWQEIFKGTDSPRKM